MNQKIKKDYIQWILDRAYNWCLPYGKYYKLIQYLHSREFIWDIPNDSNRAADGVDYRLRFADENREYTYRDVYLYLNEEPCTVLEMMMALSTKCEEHIMGDPDAGDRSGYWFFQMIQNMHMDQLEDDIFDKNIAEEHVDVMLERKYYPNGNGGLFIIQSNPTIDMREIEIWFQLNRYLNERMDNEKRV